MIKVVICENETKEVNLWYGLTCDFFKRKKIEYEVKIFFCVDDVIKDAIDYDIVLLDIELDIEIDGQKAVNGIGIAEKIREVNKNAKIIYITAHEKYRVVAQTTHYFYYVRKPINKECFDKYLQEALEYLQEQKKSTALN